MKAKGLFSLFVIMLLAISLSIPGCSKKEPAQEVKKSTAPSDGREMIGNMYKTGLPIVKDKVKLKMVASIYPDQPKFDEMPFFKNLEGKSNVTIEWDCIPQNIYKDKKNILLAANELPDAFFGPEAFNIDDANKYGPQGTVIPLDDLIDKYSQNYKAAMGKMPVLGGLTTAFDGKKYTLGTVIENEGRNFPDNLYINKAWLDKLSLKVPTTLEEYYQVLKAFKDKDPNGNGKKDEIPYTFMKYDQIRGYGSFFGAFGIPDATNGGNPTPYDHFLVDNGKVVFTPDKPEYKEAISYLSKFFKEDLFDKEGFTQDIKQFTAKGKSPEMLVGSFYGWDASELSAPENTKNYVAMAPLKGATGKDPAIRKRKNHINIQASGFAITKVNKYPDITMRWVDQFYDKKTGIEAQYGPVGITLKDKGDGSFDYMTPPQGASIADFQKKNAPYDNAPKLMTADIFGKDLPLDEITKSKIDVINKYYKNAKISESLPLMNFKPEEIKVNQTIGMDIVNLVREKQTFWLLDGGINAEWDAYTAKLKQLKLEDYIKQMQTAYDRTVGKK